MEFIISVISFLVIFIPTSIILNKIFIYFHRKFPLFKNVHYLIRNSGKEKLISSIGWIITAIYFYIISYFFSFNDYQGGFICAIINSIILTILEPEQNSSLYE